MCCVAVGGLPESHAAASDSGGRTFSALGDLSDLSARPHLSQDGRQTTDFNEREDHGEAVAVQADGRIVVAGGSNLSRNGDFAIVRYRPDGTPDPSFSEDGKVRTDLSGRRDGAHAVALQRDGKIVVAGSAGGRSGAGRDFGLARYEPDGSLDESFDEDGKQTTDFGAADEASAVLVKPDGAIVAVGRTAGANDGDFAVARYEPDGSLDESFDEDGKQTVDFDGADDSGEGVALALDGDIVAVGGSSERFEVAVLKAADGAPDPAFSQDGRDASVPGRGSSVAIQADGKIVVGGGRFSPSEGSKPPRGDVAVVRYNVNGTVDEAFGDDGTASVYRFEGLGGAYGNGVAVQGDQKIVVAGWSDDGGGGYSNSPDFALARFDSDGTVDETFSDQSYFASVPGFRGTSYDYADAVAIQRDGKVVAAGSAQEGGDGDSNVALTRLLPGGSPDSASADVALRVEGPTRAPRGEPVAYTYTLSNRGPDRSRNVEIAFDSLPAGLVFSEAGSSRACVLEASEYYAKGLLVCRSGYLASGARRTFRVRFVGEAPGAYAIETVGRSRPAFPEGATPDLRPRNSRRAVTLTVRSVPRG